MRSAIFIVTITLFGAVTAGWNHYYGHSEHHSRPSHFGSHDGSLHFGHHEPHQGPYYFGTHRESSHFGPPHKSPYVKPHFRPPYGSAQFGHPQHHHEYHFKPPHVQPSWSGPDWDRSGPEISDSSSSEEDDYDLGLTRDTQATTQWTTTTAVQTTTETARPIWNNPSSYKNTHFTTLTIYKGALSGKTNTASTPSRSYSAIVERCVTSCKKTMTPEYNPVCGTNNVTYQNIGSLLCAKGCGVDVELKRKFTCPKNGEFVTNGHFTDTTQMPTLGNNGRTKMTQNILNCMHTCSFNGDFSPVCGTDLNTYFNYDRLMCAKKCGVDTELKCRFPCATSGCHAVETTTTTATKSTSAINLAITTSPWRSLQNCLLACVVTAEYTPICGTNNITYGNPSKLLCAQLCGVDVRVKHQFKCPTPGDDIKSFPPTPAAVASTTLPPFTVACMRGCAVTPKYNPVCGTNHVTYTNPGRLDCAKMCGVDVDILIHSACKITDPNDFTKTTEPPTIGNVVTQPQPIMTGFTIDQSPLDRIFGNTVTTQTAPTTEEVFDIDPRFNNL